MKIPTTSLRDLEEYVSWNAARLLLSVARPRGLEDQALFAGNIVFKAQTSSLSAPNGNCTAVIARDKVDWSVFTQAVPEAQISSHKNWGFQGQGRWENASSREG